MWMRSLVVAGFVLVPAVGALAQAGGYGFPPMMPPLGGMQGGGYGGYQNGGYQNGGYQNNGFQNGGYQNNGFQNGGYPNNGFQNGFQNGGFPVGGALPAPGSIDFQALMKKAQAKGGGQKGHGAKPGAKPQANPQATVSKTPITGVTAKAIPDSSTKDKTATKKTDDADGDKIDPSLLAMPTHELPEAADPFPIAGDGELTADRILREFQSIDANHDGALSYLECRDRSQIDLTTFRQFDVDNSGLLDTQEFESHMVLIASARGQPIERTLKNRVDAFVSKRKSQLAEEKAKTQPSGVAEKVGVPGWAAAGAGGWSSQTCSGSMRPPLAVAAIA